MTGADVLHVLDLLAAVGVRVWVDGGWGVDALLGDQTRPHDDLDLALEHRDLARFLRAIGNAGFRLLRDDGPFNKVLVDEAGRKIDYHVFDASATRRTEAGVTVYGPMGLEYEVGAFRRSGHHPGQADGLLHGGVPDPIAHRLRAGRGRPSRRRGAPPEVRRPAPAGAREDAVTSTGSQRRSRPRQPSSPRTATRRPPRSWTRPGRSSSRTRCPTRRARCVRAARRGPCWRRWPARWP